MKVPIQDMLFAHVGQRGVGGPDCVPSYFEWQFVPTSTPARFYDDLCMRDAPNHPRPRVGWLVEVPPYAQCHYDWAVEHEAEFDCILTPCLDYAMRGKPWRWYPRGGSMLLMSEWGVPRHKLRHVSFLASGKMNATGHKLRHEIYKRFGHRLECYGGVVGCAAANKVEAIAPYRFTVVVDAERNAGCFCDHILDAFALRTIPIYWGCPDIGRWFDAFGIWQFDTLDELEDILNLLTTGHYDSRATVIEGNLEAAWQYRVPEDWLWTNYPDLFEGLE